MSRKHAKLLQERAQALAEAQEAYEDAMTEVFHAGAGIREIAREVGRDHSHVSRLLERIGVRKRWLSLEDANRELDRRDALERQRRGD